MTSDDSVRFSLDKRKPNPQLVSRIMSAEGGEVLGDWDGESIHDLLTELDRIEEFADANYAALPHQNNIPEDLRPPIATDFPIWTCDKKGLCLTGENGAEVVNINDIRSYYDKEHGGVDHFRKKILQEIKERNRNLKKD